VNGENGLSVASGVGLGPRLGSEPAQTPLQKTVARTVKDLTRKLRVASRLTVVRERKFHLMHYLFRYSCSSVVNLQEPTMR